MILKQKIPYKLSKKAIVYLEEYIQQDISSFIDKLRILQKNKYISLNDIQTVLEKQAIHIII
jgi:hypothetical protein